MSNKTVNYTAPVILEDLALELEAEILGASSSTQGEIDTNIEKVETTGQVIGGEVAASQWTQDWQ